ncbi:MAG: hypothetical protein WDN26_21000 [Chitinophagaceae bacterium]
MLNSEQNPEECDATDDHSSNAARLIIIPYYTRFLQKIKPVFPKKQNDFAEYENFLFLP